MNSQYHLLIPSAATQVIEAFSVNEEALLVHRWLQQGFYRDEEGWVQGREPFFETRFRHPLDDHRACQDEVEGYLANRDWTSKLKV